MKKSSVFVAILFLFASMGFSQNLSKRTSNLGRPFINSLEKELLLPNLHQETYKPILKSTQAEGQKLNESFEGTFPPNGWTLIDADGDGINWFPNYIDTAAPISVHSGQLCAMSASWLNYNNFPTVLKPNNYLVTPQLKVSANDTLSWWVAVQDSSYAAEHYAVMISTKNPTASDFTTIIFEETLNKDYYTWTEHKISLAQFEGQYIYVAFVHNNSTDQFIMKIDDVSGPEILSLAHDAKIVNASCNYSGTIPVNQFSGNSIKAQVQNIGTQSLSGIKITAKNGTNTIGESSVAATLNAGETSEILSISEAFAPTQTGSHTIDVIASTTEIDSNLTNNTASFTCIVSDSTFATTQDTIYGGIGSTSMAAVLGNIYTLAQADTLTSMTVGFSNSSVDAPFELVVYTFTNDTTVAELFSMPYVRTSEMAKKKNVLLLHPRVLEAGKYLFAVRQLNLTNIYVGYDRNPDGYFYTVENSTHCSKYANKTVGNLIIEANFGNNPRIITHDVAVMQFLAPVMELGPYSTTEKITVRVKNLGLSPEFNLNVNCAVNSTLLTPFVIDSLPVNAYRDVTFTANLSTPELFTVKVYTNLASDEVLTNDTITKKLQGKTAPAILWDFNKGMPKGFTFANLDLTAVSPYIESLFPNNEAWATVQDNTQGKSPLCAVSTSWLSKSVQANRWMITSQISLNTGNSMEWDAKVADKDYADGYEVRLSTTGNAPADFTKVLYSTSAESVTWTTRTVDLAEYAGQKVYIAFVQNSTDKYLLLIDNIGIFGQATTTGISSTNTNPVTELNIFPNPANNHAEIYAQDKIQTIQVVNMTGQVINTVQGINALHYNLNTASLQSGIYFIMIKTEQGNTTKKLIISR